jgi:hypothetical protein
VEFEPTVRMTVQRLSSALESVQPVPTSHLLLLKSCSKADFQGAAMHLVLPILLVGFILGASVRSSAEHGVSFKSRDLKSERPSASHLSLAKSARALFVSSMSVMSSARRVDRRTSLKLHLLRHDRSDYLEIILWAFSAGRWTKTAYEAS